MYCYNKVITWINHQIKKPRQKHISPRTVETFKKHQFRLINIFVYY